MFGLFLSNSIIFTRVCVLVRFYVSMDVIGLSKVLFQYEYTRILLQSSVSLHVFIAKG